MSKIKICGITRPEDVTVVNAALPDYIGFVFAGHSKRYVTPTQAKGLRDGLSEEILPVGVFVNEPIENIAMLFDSEIIALAQLHGGEDDNYIEALRRRSSVPVIKAVSVNSVDDIKNASESASDYVLLDHGSGGTGKTFDWDLLSMDPATSRRMTSDGTRKPFFLAGGIDLGNIEDALALAPYAIDVSSGAETDGVKDSKKIALLVNIAHMSLRA